MIVFWPAGPVTQATKRVVAEAGPAFPGSRFLQVREQPVRLLAVLGPACQRIDHRRGRYQRHLRRLTLRAVRQQLRPLFDRVVIKELEPDRIRQSGLVVPPGSHEPPPQHGIVLAVGTGLDWWAQAGIEMPVSPGDHVVFPFSAGSWVEIEEERLLVCRVGELLGVLEFIEERAALRETD